MNTFVRISVIGITAVSMLGGGMACAAGPIEREPVRNAAKVKNVAIPSGTVNIVGEAQGRTRDISNKRGTTDKKDVSVVNRNIKENHGKDRNVNIKENKVARKKTAHAHHSTHHVH